MTGKTVLLVEDNPHNRKIFSGMLDPRRLRRRRGRGRPPGAGGDVADRRCPTSSSWTCRSPASTAGRSRAASRPTRARKVVPIIALTAHAMRGDEERARAAGCDHYLAKPISPKKVVEEVRKILKMP